MAEASALRVAIALPAWLSRALDTLPYQERLPEPLQDSAHLALQWAEAHCETCRAYHGLWQYRRLIGSVKALDADGTIYQAILAQLAREEGLRRILIAASADYAMQAVVRDAFFGIGEDESVPEITLVDRCATPLLLNTWLAAQRGGSIATRQGNLLEAPLGERYDIVVSHSLFFWFSAADRRLLTRRWFQALRPGGRVLLSNRVRAEDAHDLPDVQTLSRGLVKEVENARDRLPPEVMPRLLALAPLMHRLRERHIVSSIEDLTLPFEQAGFEIEAILAAQDLLPRMKDINSFFGVQPGEAKRHLVLARRPR